MERIKFNLLENVMPFPSIKNWVGALISVADQETIFDKNRFSGLSRDLSDVTYCSSGASKAPYFATVRGRP
jgi:hypothetical protein